MPPAAAGLTAVTTAAAGEGMGLRGGAAMGAQQTQRTAAMATAAAARAQGRDLGAMAPQARTATTAGTTTGRAGAGTTDMTAGPVLLRLGLGRTPLLGPAAGRTAAERVLAAALVPGRCSCTASTRAA
jgi:hypothetical protein